MNRFNSIENKRSALKPILFSIIFLAFITGCYKAPEFVNPAYACNCGEVEFNGEAFALKMAEVVIPDSTEQLSRTYHIVADMRSEEEVDGHVAGHDLTFYMAFDQLDDVVFYIPQDSVTHLIQEINHGDAQFPVRDYISTQGSIEVDAAYAGGTETVSFSMEVREQVNGELVGFPISFSGSFSALID